MSNTPNADGQDKIEQLPEPEENDTGGVDDIKDPGEYALRRRLEQILDARERVVQARNEAHEKYEDVRNREDRENLAHGHVAQAVHEYACEVEALIAQQNEIETDWPEDTLWGDLTDYINAMGYVPGDCPAAVTGRERPDTEKRYPPESRFSLVVYRYLNRVLAEMGLDAQLDSGRDMSRY